MEVTWKHILELAQRMWGINQINMAELLEVDCSTISRLMNGQQLRFRRPFKEIYNALFAPDVSKSPAFGEKPNNLLLDMKEQIKELRLADTTKDLEEQDYENYVLSLLRLAKENEPQKPLKQGNMAQKVIEIGNNQETDKKNITQITTQSYIEMFNIFNGAILEYQIDSFLEKIDSTNMMNYTWIETCESFIKFMKSKIRIYFGQSIVIVKHVMFQKIQQFVNVLNEYTDYLSLNMRSLGETRLDIAVPLFREENEKAIRWALNFDHETKSYREQLILNLSENRSKCNAISIIRCIE